MKKWVNWNEALKFYNGITGTTVYWLETVFDLSRGKHVENCHSNLSGL